MLVKELTTKKYKGYAKPPQIKNIQYNHLLNK